MTTLVTSVAFFENIGAAGQKLSSQTPLSFQFDLPLPLLPTSLRLSELHPHPLGPFGSPHLWDLIVKDPLRLFSLWTFLIFNRNQLLIFLRFKVWCLFLKLYSPP